MGKPEGSKHRELKPAIHCLFPLGKKVGTQRRIHDAVRKPDTVMIGWRECPDCGQQGVDGVCKACGTNTDLLEIVRDHQFDMEAMWLEAKDAVMQTSDLPVKGDTYLGSGEKHPEPLEKGILRARNNTSTFRDGTVRFDMVDITMTHFRPDEIDITAQDAVRLDTPPTQRRSGDEGRPGHRDLPTGHRGSVELRGRSAERLQVRGR